VLRDIDDVMGLLDDPKVDGPSVCAFLREAGVSHVESRSVSGAQGFTDFVTVRIVSSNQAGPTLGIIGRLGGIGARPERVGMVSDADGAIVALACAVAMARMASRGDILVGDVLIATHICPCAPVIPHEPAPFMGAPVDPATMNRHEVSDAMDAILSVDTTKGNWLVNRRGFAITPTVKEGYILRTSPDLLEIMRTVSNEPPIVFPITTQDITPYGNGVYHVNSILQPSTATRAPVVGVATTASTPIAGSATGAHQILDLERASQFCVEAAKAYTTGRCAFYDEREFERLVSLYGPLSHLQTLGDHAPGNA